MLDRKVILEHNKNINMDLDKIDVYVACVNNRTELSKQGLTDEWDIAQAKKGLRDWAWELLADVTALCEDLEQNYDIEIYGEK